MRSNLLSYKPVYNAGTRLPSRTVSSTVLSAAQVLTIVFGMGTGVTPARIGTSKFKFSGLPPLLRPQPLDHSTVKHPLLDFLRKEVIQPQVLLRLPCYDFTPVTNPAFDGSFLR